MTVHLVGAGPGDPGLLTRRGADLLATADVVVYDRLTASALLDLAPSTAERVYVGKDPHGASVDQDVINAMLVELGRSGRDVVRLKGGDPFVFARGAEEAAALELAGVEYDVVPGITSALAAPAYAGIPATVRYSATNFTVVTGHEDPAKGRTDVDWEAVARVGGTIIVLMGVGRWPSISARLMDGGLPGATPAAAVRWGTTSEQHTIRATLATLGDHPLAAPSVIVVGDVARESLDWFTSRPLFGRTVVVTRARASGRGLVSRLESAGASVVVAPTIAFTDPTDGGEALAAVPRRLRSADWVVFSSVNGAQRLCEQLRDARDLAGVKVAAVGERTADALRLFGVEADLVPPRFIGEALVEVFPAPTVRGGKVLVIGAEQGRAVIPDGLSALGWTVDFVAAYRTIAVQPTAETVAAVQGADAVCFTSGSTVDNFVSAFGRDLAPAVIAAIGPATSDAVRAQGLEVTVVGEPHTVEGLVTSLCAHYGDARS